MFNPRERHFSVADLAANLNLSTDCVRDLFRNEPGVIVIERPRKGCRGYQTLRIPESVAQRVYERLKSKPHRSPYRGGAR